MAKKKRKQSDQPLKFHEALERLEQIVTQLEEGQLGLEETLHEYEQGIGHLRRCYELLAAAEQRIELLGDVDEEGRPQTTPFATDEDHEQTSRSPRRSRPRGSGGGEANGPDVDADSRLF